MPKKSYKKYEEQPELIWNKTNSSGETMDEDDFAEFKDEFSKINSLRSFNGESSSELARSLSERARKHFNDFLTAFNEDIETGNPMSDQACESLKSFLVVGELCYSVSNNQMPDLANAFNDSKDKYQMFEEVALEEIGNQQKILDEFNYITNDPTYLSEFASNPDMAFGKIDKEIGYRIKNKVQSKIDDVRFSEEEELTQKNLENIRREISEQEAKDKEEKEQEAKEKEEKEKREKEELEAEENRELEEEEPEEIKRYKELLKKEEEKKAAPKEAPKEEPKELTAEEKEAAVRNYEQLKEKYEADDKRRDEELKANSVGYTNDNDLVQGYNQMADTVSRVAEQHKRKLAEERKKIYGYRSKEDTIKDLLENDYAETLKEYPGMETVIRNFEGAKYDYVTAKPGTELDAAKKMLYYGTTMKLYQNNQYSDYDYYDDQFCPDGFIEAFFAGADKQKAFKDDMDNILNTAQSAYKESYEEDYKDIIDRIEGDSLEQNEKNYTQQFIDQGEKLAKKANGILIESPEGVASGSRSRKVLEEAEKLYVKQLTSTSREECIDLTTEFILKTREAYRVRTTPEASDEAIHADYDSTKPVLKEYLTNLAGEDKWASNLKKLLKGEYGADIYDNQKSLFEKIEGLDYDYLGEEVNNHDQYSEEELKGFKQTDEYWYDKVESSLDKGLDIEGVPENLQKNALTKIQPAYDAFVAVRTERDLEEVYEAAATAIVNTREYYRAIVPGGDTNEERIKFNRDEDIEAITEYLKEKYENNTTELRNNFNKIDNTFVKFCEKIHKDLHLSPFNLSIEEYNKALVGVVEDIKEETKSQDDTKSKFEREKESSIKNYRRDILNANDDLNKIVPLLGSAIKEKNQLDAYKKSPEGADFIINYGAANSSSYFSKYIKQAYAEKPEVIAQKVKTEASFNELVSEVNDAVKKVFENKSYTKNIDEEQKEFLDFKSSPEARSQNVQRYDALVKLNKAKEPDQIYQAAAEVLSAHLFHKDMRGNQTFSQSKNEIEHNAKIIKPYLEKIAPKEITNMAASLKETIINSRSRGVIAKNIEEQFKKDLLDKRKEDLKNVLKAAGLDPNDKKSLANIITLNAEGQEKSFDKSKDIVSFSQALSQRINSVGQLGGQLNIAGNTFNNINYEKGIDEHIEGFASVDGLNDATLNYLGRFINESRVAIKSPDNPEEVRFIVYGEDGLKLSEPINQLRGLDDAKAKELGFKGIKTLNNAIKRYDNVVKLQKEFDPKAAMAKLKEFEADTSIDNYKLYTNMINWTAKFIDKQGIVNDAPSKEYLKDNIIDSSKAEIKEESSKEADKKEIKTEEAKYEINTEAVKEEIKTEEAQYEINTDAPTEEIKTEAPTEETKKDAQLPSENNAPEETLEQERAHFKKMAEALDNAKTVVNSKEYRKLIVACETLADPKGKLTPDSRKAMIAATGQCINDYLAHKAKDGVKPNVFKKFAAVEAMSKYINTKLQPYKGETINIGQDQNVVVENLKLDFNENRDQYRGSTKALIDEGIVTSNNIDKIYNMKKSPLKNNMMLATNFLRRVGYMGEEKLQNNAVLKDIQEAANKFADSKFAKAQLTEEKKELEQTVEQTGMHM